MKQLTMTKVLTPLAALAFAFGVQAAIVPVETFDGSGDVGQSVTNRTGWSFTPGADLADDASVITAYGESATPAYLPDGQSAGANYLKLSTEDGTLFRNMKTDGNSLDLYGGLFVDTDVQFTVTDASDSPTNTVDAADKFVIWLEAGEEQGVAYTNLCVLGHSFGATTATRTDKVYTLKPAFGTLSIIPGEWHRLTVKAVSSFTATGETLSYPAFQVYLDGNQLFANENIAGDGDQEALGIEDFTSFLGYFPARAATMTSLTKVGFSGEGALDSVVVTRDVPTCAGGVAVAVTWDTTVLDYVEVKTADGQNAFGETLTTSPVTIKVDPGVQFALVPTYKSGYSASTHAVSYAAAVGSAATVDATGVVTATGAGAIDVTTTPRDTVKVSFDFANLMTHIGEAMASDFVSVVFSINGVTEKTVTISNWDEEKDDDTDGIFSFEGLKLGTNVAITVTYAQNSGWTTEAAETPDTSCLTRSSYTFTVTSLPEGRAATVAVDAFKPGATVDGDPVRTFADALTAALDKGTATIALAQDATASEAAEIAANKNITIDLAGYTITGASGEAAVFSVLANGTLTITNSTVTVGAVVAGSATACISNAGTLNLQAGNFNGAISGGTIYVTGGAFTHDISSGATFPTGYGLEAVPGAVTYVYAFRALPYDITYYYEGTSLTIAGATTSYTVEDNVTLPTTNDVNTALTTAGIDGVTFDSWTNATGTVAGWVAGEKTGDQIFYVKTAAITPSGEELAPGEQSSATYATAEAATNALANVTITASAAVATELGDTTTYLTKFEKKVVESNGEYKIEIGLTAAATSDLTTDAGDQAATLAAQLSTVAATADATSVDLTGAEPGFYYSVGYATTVAGPYVEGTRAMADSTGAVSLPIPAKTGGATAGFYKVFINVADKPAN